MSEVADKWGVGVAERGFAQIPNYLLLLNRFLDTEVRLSPLELLILIQLAGAWWRKAKLPFPSMTTLAVRCGASERQVHRAISHLEALNLIKREKRRIKGLIASNVYDLAPLATILNEISIQYPNDRPRNVVSVERLEKLKTEEVLLGTHVTEVDFGMELPKKPPKKLVRVRKMAKSSSAEPKA